MYYLYLFESNEFFEFIKANFDDCFLNCIAKDYNLLKNMIIALLG